MHIQVEVDKKRLERIESQKNDAWIETICLKRQYSNSHCRGYPHLECNAACEDVEV